MTKYSEQIRRAAELHKNERRKGLYSSKNYRTDATELNKWMADDFTRQISVDFNKRYKSIIRQYKDLEPLSKSILQLHKSIWNNGLENVTPEMPEEQRREIYNKKLMTNFWYSCFNYIKQTAERRDFDNMHDHIDENREKRYSNERIKKVEPADNTTDEEKWKEALIEAIFEYFSNNKTLMVESKARNMAPAEREKLGINAYRMFDMYFRQHMGQKEIGEIVGCVTNNVSARNMKSIVNLKKHITEIIEIAERIYDEKYQFS